MSVEVRHEGTCVVVSVVGRFDEGDAGWLADAVARLCAEEPSATLVIDLGGVAVVERRAASRLAADLEALGGRVALVASRLSARRILRRWGGERMLLYPSVSAAVEQLSAPSALSAVRAGPPVALSRFRHEAMPYAGIDELVERTASFVSDGLAAEEPVLVALGAPKLDRLRARLGADAEAVRFADMAEVGHNPARIIPLWRDFVDAHAGGGRRPRGVGEPIWPERTAAELAECQRHESLLNVAFGEGPPWWLLCPYDTAALDPCVVEECHRNHPYVFEGGVHRRSDRYVDDGERVAAELAEPLPEPSAPAPELEFDRRTLGAVAGFVGRHGAEAGLWADEARDLARAVSEVANNSVLHGGGTGRVRVWREGADVVCEVSDAGHIRSPLVGRERRPVDPEGRRGLWLANQLCDLVQVRSSPAGTVVRLHLRPRAADGGATGP